MLKKPKLKNVKPPGICIFCGGGAIPGNPMTGEHLWSDWMKNILPKYTEPHRAEGFAIEEFKDAPRQEKIYIRQGVPNSKKIKAVCKACNSGWMNRLETAARPILTRLINGDPCSLSTASQRVLAQWIALKIMVSEHQNKNVYVTPEIDRRTFMNALTIPSYFHIRIGFCGEDPWRNAVLRQSISLLNDEFEIPEQRAPHNSQSVVWGLGNLFVIHFATIASTLKIDLNPEVDGFVPSISPKRRGNIAWPPTRRLSSGEANKFSGSFRRAIDLITDGVQWVRNR
jgi:hypothetical protein